MTQNQTTGSKIFPSIESLNHKIDILINVFYCCHIKSTSAILI